MSIIIVLLFSSFPLPSCFPAASTSRKALCRPLSKPTVSDSLLVWLVRPHFSQFSGPQPLALQLSWRPLSPTPENTLFPKGKILGQITQLLS